MRITKLELFMVEPRWLFLKVHTDRGITGYGEPVLEGQVSSVAAAVRDLEGYLVGKDPRRIEHHWQAMYRGGFYRGPVRASAISGIEQAMWDILGKSLGAPVYQLLGGACRSRIKLYGHISSLSRERMMSSAEEGMSRGFKAFKLSPRAPIHFLESRAFLEEYASDFEALRRAVGGSIDLAVDFHGRFSPALAKRFIEMLEPHYPYFVEEPCPPENIDALAEVAHSTTVPIAAGERCYTKWGFREIIAKRAVQIIQPDLCHAGGILEGRKIAAMAEASYMAVAPHNPLGPIALAAALQLDACTPNFLIQEQATLGEGYLKKPFELEGGYVRLPEGPGLGIELDDEAVEEKKCGSIGSNPMVFHEDDEAVADW